MKIQNLLWGILLVVAACGSPTFEEKINTILEAEVGEGVYYEITRMDTVNIENVNNAKSENDTAQQILAQQAIDLPKQIEATIQRIEKAKAESAKSNGFFKESWENLALQDEVTLQKLKNLQLGNEIRLEEAKKQAAFIEKVLPQAEGDIVYYIVDAKVGNDTTRYFISPKFELLEQ